MNILQSTSPRYQFQNQGCLPHLTRRSSRNHLNLLLVPLVLALSLNTGSAFIPLFGIRIDAALAMSTDSSKTSISPGGTPPSISPSASGANGGDARKSEAVQDPLPDDNNDVPLLLPPDDSNDPSIPRIKLGDTISFQEMGPVIINADGTTRRIDNWDKMTKHEQEVAWRRIAKRNQARREALLEQQRKEDEAKQEES